MFAVGTTAPYGTQRYRLLPGKFGTGWLRGKLADFGFVLASGNGKTKCVVSETKAQATYTSLASF